MVILASAPCVAQNISGLWRSHRLRIVKVCAISKRVLERSPQSCAVWDCATPWPDRHWPTPTSYVTGASGLMSDLAAVLIKRARKLYLKDDFGLDLANTVYALDSTTIDLCLSLFPWAYFRSTKGAVKMHTLLDLRGPIPSFIHISDGKMGDALALDLITPEAGAIYVMDRGYVDFQRLYVIHQAGAFFVTRTKVNMKYHRVYSHPVPDPATGVGSDQSIALDGFYTKQDYPQHLRRVSFRDPETGLHLVFLTNNFTLSATMIAALYKKRWAVELFFKWIKQNLRIKHFYGTSENAVKTQIWIAVCVYVLAAIIKIDLALDVSLYTFLQI